MAVDVEPPELAAVLDVAERPRAQEWSLRAALTRYAQPQPERASALIELVRRTEGALRPFTKQLVRDGEVIWAAVAGERTPDEADEFVVALLQATAELDRLGDALAVWAVERAGPRPDSLVDAVVADVTARLDALGVAREERVRPTPRH